MDAEQFDAVARALRDGASRRTLVGLSLGGLLGTYGFLEAEGKRKKGKKKKKKCKGDTRKCGKKCIPSANCCSSADCGEGATCLAGTCDCPHRCCLDTDCPVGSGKACRENLCRCPSGQGQSGGVCSSEVPDPNSCFEPPSNCATNEQCCNDRCEAGKCTFSELGEPCLQGWYCVEGLTCKGFVCAPKSQAGGPCSVQGDCEGFGLQCEDSVCV